MLMNKRDETDIWANMYDLPLVETSELINIKNLNNLPIVKTIFGEENLITESFALTRHVLTHQRLYVRLVKSVNQPVYLSDNWLYIDVDKLSTLPLPRIIYLFLKDYFNL